MLDTLEQFIIDYAKHQICQQVKKVMLTSQLGGNDIFCPALYRML